MAEPVPQQKMSTKELMIVIVIALGSFMAGLDATIVNIALPAIAKSFEVSTVMVSWVLNAYLIILVSLLLAASRLGDMKGYRNIFIGGFALFTIGSALCGLSPTIGMLILARMVQAVGGAVISALGAVMVTSYLSTSLRGQALGIVAMFTMLGAALGPVVGGFLTSAFSWQYIFFVNLPVGIVAIILGMKILPQRDPVSPAAKLDIPGVLLVFVALSTLIVGLTSVQGSNAMPGLIALVISVIFWILFIVRERRAAQPLVNLSLFAHRGYSLQNVNVMLIQMAMAGVMVIMPFYLELVKKIPTDNAGTILLALPIGMILTAPLAGRISDVIGTKKPIITGFVICTIALLLLSTLSAHTSVGHIGIYLFLLGAGTGIAFSPLNSAVMGECEAKDRGSTSGLVKMMTNLGSSLGVAFVMLVATIAAGPKLAEYSAHTLEGAGLASAFDAAFLFCMGLEILGILLMLAVKDKMPSGSSDGEVAMGF
ncbi:MFS transporter [Methanoregula sp.]|uniref:MFS transporter n=1 Tax=Methanoregula sp. TaxID=2052170 RepID=UPI00237434FE|nr:MFS transporter [Methanoregula sp.]MDD1687373.1 MFS transporter [Methanoregula sp.]